MIPVEAKRAFAVQQVDHVALTVSDVQRSARWYADVLGLKRRHEDVWGDYPVMLYAGTTAIALFPSAIPRAVPAPDSRTSLVVRHIAFRLDGSDFARAEKDLRSRSIPFEIQDHRIARSIYFRDPDGYELELTTYYF